MAAWPRLLLPCLFGLLAACPGGLAGEGGELEFLGKVRELFPYVDKNIDGVLTCKELKYPGCSEDAARAAEAGRLDRAEGGGEEGFGMAGFAELLKELAEKNGKGRVEFADSALRYQKHGVKQEL